MELFLENPGLCHIGESIFKSLDFKTQLTCRLVRKSWKDMLEKEASKINLKQLLTKSIYRINIGEWEPFLEKLKTELPIHIISSYLQHILSIRKIYPYPEILKLRPLMVFAVSGNLKMLQLFLDLKPIPISKEWGNDHCTALVMAATFGHTNVVKYLKRFFSTAIPMNVHKSAISLTASNGNLETLRILMDDLANPDDAVDDWLFTNVSKSGHIQIMKYLQQKLSRKCFKLYLTAISPVGNTVFHAAAGHGHLEMLKYLCQKAPKNIMQLDTLGNTPLHSAAASGHFEVVRFLTAYTSNPNVTNGLGWTSSRIARSQGFHDIEEFLSNYPVSKKIKL